MEEKMVKILYEINEEAANYYFAMLRSNQGTEGIESLKRFGLTKETTDRFRLGFAGDCKRGLVDFLKGKGYMDDQIIEAGLADVVSDDSIEDKFRKRIIIPLIDDERRVIGFSGRAVEDGMPIYLNSHSTMIFDKRSSLFGLNHVKDTAAKFCILCEGFMDVMTLHQAGFDMAVALLGNRFTPEHAKKIKKYVQDAIICFDCDEEGRYAASKAADILVEMGVNVEQIDLSPHKDPFEYINKEGGASFGELLRSVLSKKE